MKVQLITRLFKKFCFSCKILDDQERSMLQNQRVALGEYQASLASHSLVLFVTFMTSRNASKAAKLFLTLPKYCKTLWHYFTLCVIWKLVHNAAKITKNIYYEKGEDAVDHTKVTRCFKWFGEGCKNLNDQRRSGKPSIPMPCSKNSE